MADRITLADLKARLLAERGHGRDSWPWTLRFLDRADEQFGGCWTVTTLSAIDAAGVLLPAHAGEPCRGDRMALVPAGGATVAQIADRLRDIQDVYARDNAECWRRILRASHQPFSTVVLSAAPLATREHAGLAPRAGALFHIDGFHRLVGWAFAGRLIGQATIPAVMAGELAGMPGRPA
jgi:hypothetical protein